MRGLRRCDLTRRASCLVCGSGGDGARNALQIDATLIVMGLHARRTGRGPLAQAWLSAYRNLTVQPVLVMREHEPQD